jgi:predicted nucleic acid-binding protein
MIILDTNVVSEPLKPAFDERVANWLDRQKARALYLTAITAAELLSGAEKLQPGRRRSELETKISAILNRFGEERILPFDLLAARFFGVLVLRARAAGVGIAPMDAQIAAIAASRGYVVATRDTAPFVAAGVPVLNPWDGPHA